MEEEGDMRRVPHRISIDAVGNEQCFESAMVTLTNVCTSMPIHSTTTKCYSILLRHKTKGMKTQEFLLGGLNKRKEDACKDEYRHISCIGKITTRIDVFHLCVRSNGRETTFFQEIG